MTKQTTTPSDTKIDSVTCSMPFNNGKFLTISSGDDPNARIWLNREQAMQLLGVLPEWIAKMPVSLT